MSNFESPNNESGEQPASRDAPIAFRGSLTVPDAYAAISLAQPRGNKIAIWIVRAFFVAALGYMSWITAYAYFDEEYNLARLAFAGAILVLIPITVAIGREIWYRRRANQLCKEGKHLYAPTDGEVDDTSVRSKTETGEGKLNWSAFRGYRVADAVAVLYLQFPGSYVIMARSKFGSDQEWIGFLQLTSRKLKQI